MEHGRALRYARRLLHRVRDDDDRVVLPQLVDQFLDLGGGDRVERRARLVHQDDFRRNGDRARDAQALLLAAGQAGAGLRQPVLDLVPQRRLLQAGLDDLIELRLARRQSVDARAVGDVLVDRLGKRVRLLEHHADAGTQFDDVDLGIVDVLAVERDLAADTRAVDRVVHPVEAAQERRLAAARRADQRRNLLFADVEIDAEQRLLLAVVDGDLLATHLERRVHWTSD